MGSGKFKMREFKIWNSLVVVSWWLLVVGCWLVVVGYWLLVGVLFSGVIRDDLDSIKFSSNDIHRLYQ